jgi:hypothetical protein
VTSVTEPHFADGDLAGLLLAVGAEPPIGPEIFDDSFQDLDIDSTARAQIAVLVAERWGVNVQDRLTADATPRDLRRFILEGTAERSAVR